MLNKLAKRSCRIGLIGLNLLDPCSEPKDVGSSMCRSSFPKFYFDQKTKSCKQFVYSGCGGNSNKFDDKMECEKTCVGKIFYKSLVVS